MSVHLFTSLYLVPRRMFEIDMFLSVEQLEKKYMRKVVAGLQIRGYKRFFFL